MCDAFWFVGTFHLVARTVLLGTVCFMECYDLMG